MDKLQAGRELDALVAEKVMGYKPANEVTGSSLGIGLWEKPNGKWINNVNLPRHSTDIAAAWEVHCKACSWLFSKRKRYFAALQEQTRIEDGLVAWPDVLVVLRDRMPEAICLAALEVERDENSNLAHGLRG